MPECAVRAEESFELAQRNPGENASLAEDFKIQETHPVLRGALTIAAAIFIACIFTTASAQSDPATVKIEVHTDRPQGAWQSIWNFWGYDEPNYTYAANGKNLAARIRAAQS